MSDKDRYTAIIDDLAHKIYQVFQGDKPIDLISETYPDMDIGTAYHISQAVLQLRLKDGESLIGKKIGLTAEAVQKMLGVFEPDYGFITDSQQIENKGSVDVDKQLSTPMMEAEIAIILAHDLPMHDVTADQVKAATDYLVPSFEIVDTRFNNQKITIVDTVADNASMALFALGDERVKPDTIDAASIHCEVFRNGEQVSEGFGKAVMGSPYESVAWLANRMGALGVQLNAGDILLPGSLVPFTPIAKGDHYEAVFTNLGRVTLNFA